MILYELEKMKIKTGLNMEPDYSPVLPKHLMNAEFRQY